MPHEPAGTAARDDKTGTAGQGVAITKPGAIALLGLVGSIKTTGATLATVSLVTASQQLGLSPFLTSASSSAIALAIAATAVAAGVAADRLGRRRILMASYVLAVAANLAIFLVPSGAVYLGGLLLAGVAYGAMITGSYAYVKAVAPGRSLGWGLGLFGMYMTIVSTVTSLCGGALTAVDWRWLFLVVPVMCVACTVLTPRLLPPMPRTDSGPLDLKGLVALGLGMVLVILGVSEVTAHPPERSGWILIAAGVTAFAVWAVLERRGKAPAFPVRLFASRPFVAAVVVGFAFPMVSAAMTLTISDAVQYVRQGSAFGATVALEPFFIAGGVAGLIAGRRLSAGLSERRVIAGGSLLSAAGFLALVPLGQTSPLWLFLPGVVIVGFGGFAAMTAQGQLIVRAAGERGYGAVTASKTSISQLGNALGMVVTMLVLKLITGADIYRDLKTAGVSEATMRQAIAAVQDGAAGTGQPDLQQFPRALAQVLGSYSGALHWVMALCAAVMGLTALAVWWLMRERPEAGTPPAA